MVYGIDERFGRFHGVDGFEVSGREALISAALAQEVGAKAGDTITLRVAKPTDIPLSSLQGRRETTGERIRVTVTRVLDDAALGEFSLAPSQGPVFAIYLPIGRLQRDLGLGDRANTILLSLNDTGRRRSREAGSRVDRAGRVARRSRPARPHGRTQATARGRCRPPTHHRCRDARRVADRRPGRRRSKTSPRATSGWSCRR